MGFMTIDAQCTPAGWVFAQFGTVQLIMTARQAREFARCITSAAADLEAQEAEIERIDAGANGDIIA